MTTCCAPACSQALPVKPQGVWVRGSEAWAGSRDLRNLEFVRWGSSGPSSLMYHGNTGIIVVTFLLSLASLNIVRSSACIHGILQGCQPVRNFRILYGFYMQNTGVRIWPRKYGNWALSVLSLKVLLPEQSLPVMGSKSVRICGILCLRTFKYLFNHQNIQASLFHM